MQGLHGALTVGFAESALAMAHMMIGVKFILTRMMRMQIVSSVLYCLGPAKLAEV